MNKKTYLSPEIEVQRFSFETVLTQVIDSKPEGSGDYVDDGGDE